MTKEQILDAIKEMSVLELNERNVSFRIKRLSKSN